MSGIQQGLLGSFGGADPNVSVNVTGVFATGSPGSVSVTIVDPIVLPAGTVLLFDRDSVGTAIPTGWTQITDVGGSVVNFTIRGGTSTARSTGTGGTIQLVAGNYTLGTGGPHNPAAYFPVAAPTPTVQRGGGGPPASGLGARAEPHGGHTHVLAIPAPSGPAQGKAFPSPGNVDVGNQQGMRIPLIKTSTTQSTIPAGAIVFSGDSTVFSSFSRKSWPGFTNPLGTTPVPTAAGMYTISPSVNETIPFPEKFNSNATNFPAPAFALSSSGSHNHAPPTTPNLIGSPGTARNRGWPDVGAHTHAFSTLDTVNNGNIGAGVWLQFTHLLPCVAATSQVPQVGMIIMYDGGAIPSGWSLCDGTNGTPDMVGKYLGYNNALSTSGVDVGTPQIGGAPPALPTQPGFNTTPGPSATVRQVRVGIRAVGNTWPHTHNPPSPTFLRSAPASDSIRSHTSTTIDHLHFLNSGDPGAILFQMPVIPVAANLTIRFIRKD